MTPPARSQAAPIGRRELRLLSGLTLFAYVTTHFVCHALGLASLSLAERALALSVSVWHALPGTVLLYGAAAIHIALAMLAVYERRTLRMPAVQLLRIALGFGMPLLVIGHVAATRMASDLQALSPTYTRIVWTLWNSDGEGRQLALLAPGWAHGCLGLDFALGRRWWWQRLRPLLFGLALLLPVLAGLGFLTMGREMAVLAGDPAWLRSVQVASAAQQLAIGRTRDALLGGYFLLIGLVFVARLVRGQVERQRKSVVEIAYPHRTIDVPKGWSVLEGSRSFGLAHLSLCGGNARCSTCRVRVVSGGQHCPAPGPAERQTLQRVGAPEDVRLACQLRPFGDIAVVPLLDAQAGPSAGREAAAPVVEREVALLLVKLTGWRGVIDSGRSSHDVVYALNRVLAVVGDAIGQAGGLPGRLDNEGAMASFGLTTELPTACRQALQAAAAIAQGLDALNARLQQEVGLVCGFALVVHAGTAVVGPVGYGNNRIRSAVGESVLVARTLRDQVAASARRFGISRDAADAAGLEMADAAWQPLAVPGMQAQPLVAMGTGVPAAAPQPMQNAVH